MESTIRTVIHRKHLTETHHSPIESYKPVAAFETPVRFLFPSFNW